MVWSGAMMPAFDTSSCDLSLGGELSLGAAFRRTELFGRYAFFAVVVLTLAACPPGKGQGFVTGDLRIDNCNNGEALVGAFDLAADFYAADPLFDSTADATLRRSRINVRIQGTSNNTEETNGATFEFGMRPTAKAFATSDVLPLTDDSLMPASTSIDTVARMQLTLPVSCPTSLTPLRAFAVEVASKPDDDRERCDSAGKPLPPCPTLTADARAQLLSVCAGEDIGDQSKRATIESLLLPGGRGACAFICEMGQLKRGAGTDKTDNFEISYGDTFAAIFASQLIDGRAVRLGTCANALGKVVGTFRFKIERSRVAQPFP